MTTTPFLPPGTRLGPYQVEGAIAHGGMGEVYRATDTRLGRVVVLKTLRAGFESTPARRDRFEREARLLAGLTHPRICTLLDVGFDAGVQFLVIEYLEGETLTQRLARGPLPFPTVIQYGIEIADALIAAHAQGVVHRDLKPGNVMVTDAGIRLLDFGIARAMDRCAHAAGSAASDATQTGEGGLLGTSGYMAPEQLEGRAIDHRADVFAFGALLYEMSAGRPAFAGATRAATAAAVLASDPLPIDETGGVPLDFERLVRKCLAKAPADRWQDVRDVRAVLEWLAEGRAQRRWARSARRNHRRLAVVAGIAVALAAATLWLVSSSRRSGPVPAVAFDLAPPDGTQWTMVSAGRPFAVSLDGTSVVMAVRDDRGRSTLRLRPLGSTRAVPLPSTDGAANPFWSPDGAEVGFFAQRSLQAIRVADGTLRNITTVSGPGTASWGSAGVIVFTDGRPGLWRVAAAGGTREPLPVAAGAQGRIEQPGFLPDGRRFIYNRVSVDPVTTGTWLASLDAAPEVRLLPFRTVAAFAPPDHLLYARDGRLWAQTFRLSSGTLAGTPLDVGAVPSETAQARFDGSDGTLALMAGEGPAERLVWLDRSGRPLRAYDVTGDFTHLSLSPDESSLLFRNLRGPRGLAVLDLERGVASSVANGNMGVWAPDGSRFAFSTSSTGGVWVRWIGTGRVDTLLDSGAGNVHDWSPDGRAIVLASTSATTGWDIEVLDVATRRLTSRVQTAANEFHGAVSPDGAWLAYASDIEGSLEVFVEPFAGPGTALRVSPDGGAQPMWRSDSRELYYVDLVDRLMSVAVQAGPRLRLGSPQPLFVVPARGGGRSRNSYAPSADGQRFLASIRDAGDDWPVTVSRPWQSVMPRR